MKLLQKTTSLLALAILLGCQVPTSESIDISISDDITGSNATSIAGINTNTIIELMGIKENPFNHGRLRVSTLSGVHLNEIQQIKLNPVVSMAEYQQQMRALEINQFISEVDSLLANLKTVERGKNASSLLRPMHKELWRLVNSRATKKYALFFTDLQENSSQLFSSYSKTDMEFLKTNPEAFTERVLKNAPLPERLEGIKIFIIHNPENSYFNKHFLIISEWYSQLLTERGAVVSIQANLVLD